MPRQAGERIERLLPDAANLFSVPHFLLHRRRAMTRFVLVTLLAAVPLFATDPRKPDEAKAAAMKAAQAMREATVKGDLGAVIDLTPDSVVKESGGKETVEKAMKEMQKYRASQGLAIKSFTVGELGELFTEGDNTFVVVSTTLEMKVPTGIMVYKTFLLGISADAGKTWKFADGAGFKDKELTAKMIPKLPAKLKLPEVGEPEYVRTKVVAEPSKPGEERAGAKKLAQAMGDATVKGDPLAVLDHTYEPVIKELMGGQKAAEERRKKLFEKFADDGIKYKSYTVGDPGDLYTEGDNTFVVLPTTMEMTTPLGVMKGKAYLLGISTDAGKTWKFVDGPVLQDKKAREKVLPKLPEKLELPELTRPELVKDK